MLGANEFGPDFQRVLVKACVNDGHLRLIVKQFIGLRQLGFTDPASAWAWSLIDASKTPTMLMLITEAARVAASDPAKMGVQAILTAKDVRDSRYAAEQIIEWARRQLFATAFEEARQAWTVGNVDKAQAQMMSRLEEMSQLTIGDADRGWFFEELDQRQERRAIVEAGMDVFPTGVEPVDKAMYGGLSIGELGIAIAYSKIGKSFWLNQVGFIATRMRRRVLHFVLEGGRPKCEDRYEARFMETFYGDVRKGKIASADMARQRREYTILKGNLVIRGHADKDAWNVTPDDILTEIKVLREQFGWKPDMLVIDYGDLIHAAGDSPRERQMNAFRMLKNLADRGLCVWTASQAVRPAKGADVKEHLIKARDIADCYEKVRVADALLSLNRTILETEHRQARVYLSDYRDAEAQRVVRVETDYDHGSFTKLGAPVPTAPTPPKK